MKTANSTNFSLLWMSLGSPSSLYDTPSRGKAGRNVLSGGSDVDR